MNDEQRLRDLVDEEGDKLGWSESYRYSLCSTGRNLMLFLGGYDAMVFAEREDVEAWLRTKLASVSTTYGNKIRICRVYEILVDSGTISRNPAAAIRVPAPSCQSHTNKPPMDLKDVRKLFDLARRQSFTVEGAKGYLVLCLRLRCGMRYATMARCRVGDLRLTEDGGMLRGYDGTKKRDIVYPVDEESANAIRNFLGMRGAYSDEDPLISKSGYRGSPTSGFYGGANLQERVSVLCKSCGLSVGDYDLKKTSVMLAYAEGADIVQATALAATESLALAGQVAKELAGTDPREIRRRYLEGIDSTDPIATGLIRAEDVIDIVPTAYRVSSLKVTIGADGWAKLEPLTTDDAKKAKADIFYVGQGPKR